VASGPHDPGALGGVGGRTAAGRGAPAGLWAAPRRPRCSHTGAAQARRQQCGWHPGAPRQARGLLPRSCGHPLSACSVSGVRWRRGGVGLRPTGRPRVAAPGIGVGSTGAGRCHASRAPVPSGRHAQPGGARPSPGLSWGSNQGGPSAEALRRGHGPSVLRRVEGEDREGRSAQEARRLVVVPAHQLAQQRGEQPWVDRETRTDCGPGDADRGWPPGVDRAPAARASPSAPPGPAGPGQPRRASDANGGGGGGILGPSGARPMLARRVLYLEDIYYKYSLLNDL
jgi:hypothetical protein